MKVVHSWLKEYLGDALPSPERVEELLTFHSFEVEGIETVGEEIVIDVDVLPNRSSDCLCHRGIARELASLLNIDLEHDPLAVTPSLAVTKKIQIDIQNEKACSRFTAALFTDVTVKESPVWLQRRLKALGVRSINNIVDATNYVMFALGEPVHAYDADLFPQVDGVWQFVVRTALPGEEVSLLSDGGKDTMNAVSKESALEQEDRIVVCKGDELLIVDGSSNTPIGLAGVKGGRFAGVHAGTKNIIIEAAHFDPITTRKTARGLGIVIDASKRFENEPARALPPYAQSELIALITDIAGGTFEGYVDTYPTEKHNPEVKVLTSSVNSLLGLQLTNGEVSSLLKRIGATVVQHDGYCVATGPFERSDLLIEADFIEEVGRLYGLNNIISVFPESAASTSVNKRQFHSDYIRRILISLGFSEVVTSTFRKKGIVQLRNALASDKSYVRESLRKNILEVLDKNISHLDLLGISAVRVFEIGTVFSGGDGAVSEHVSIAIGVRTKGNGYNSVDDKELLQAISLLEKAGIILDWSTEKGVSEANLSTFIEAASVPEKYESYNKKPNVRYTPVSVYPASSRDIALWVGRNESAEDIQMVLTKAAGPLLARLTLFDTFSKDGRISYAFRLVFQASDRTLTEPEITEVMEGILNLVESHDWEVR